MEEKAEGMLQIKLVELLLGFFWCQEKLDMIFF
jgi:hypothetical protein